MVWFIYKIVRRRVLCVVEWNEFVILSASMATTAPKL